MLRAEGECFDSSSCDDVMRVKISDKIFALQMAINDCAVNELLFTLYKTDMLNFTVKNVDKLTTTWLTAISSDVTDVFGAGQPCEV